MEAKVTAAWPFRTLQGLAGREFCKDEWRPVLPGFEEEAVRHPWLEVREPSVSVETVIEPVKMVDESAPGTFVVPTGFKGEEFPAPVESVAVSVETVIEPKLKAPVKPVPAPKPRTTISKGKGGKK